MNDYEFFRQNGYLIYKGYRISKPLFNEIIIQKLPAELSIAPVKNIDEAKELIDSICDQSNCNQSTQSWDAISSAELILREMVALGHTVTPNEWIHLFNKALAWQQLNEKHKAFSATN